MKNLATVLPVSLLVIALGASTALRADPGNSRNYKSPTGGITLYESGGTSASSSSAPAAGPAAPGTAVPGSATTGTATAETAAAGTTAQAGTVSTSSTVAATPPPPPAPALPAPPPRTGDNRSYHSATGGITIALPSMTADQPAPAPGGPTNHRNFP